MYKLVCRLFLALLAIFLCACEGTNEPPLRVGTNTWVGYEPLYLARDLGHYDDSAIKLVEMTSASDVIHALRAGSLEAAALTLDEVLLLLSDGFDLQIVLVIDYSNGADVLLAKPAYKSVSDLRGRRVVVENSAVGAILLDGALQAAGMSAEDITLVSCLADQHITCFNDADAVVTFEPIQSELVAAGASQLYDSSQIPNRIIDVLVVRKDVVDTNTRAIKKLLRGYFSAIDRISSGQHSIAFRSAIAGDNQTPESIGIRLPSLAENKFLLLGNPAPFEGQLTQLMDFMVQRKLLGGVSEIKDVATAKFLPDSNE